MACYTQEEISEAVKMAQQTIADRLKVLPNLESFPKSVKLSALYQDDFQVPIYNVWAFGKKMLCNNINDTYAPLDVFDWCDMIRVLRGKKLGETKDGKGKYEHSISEIENKLFEGKSNAFALDKDHIKVNDYTNLLSGISESVLLSCKSHQINRGDQEPFFDFTEGWFRNSGLYGLSEKRQKQFFEWF